MRRAMVAVAALICAATAGCFFPLMPFEAPSKPPVAVKGSNLRAFASVENIFPSSGVDPLSWGWVWVEHAGEDRKSVVYIKALRKDNPDKTPERVLTVTLKQGSGIEAMLMAGASDSEAYLFVPGGWYKIGLSKGKAKLGAFTHQPNETRSSMPVLLEGGRILAGSLLKDGDYWYSTVELKSGKTEPLTLSGWSKFTQGGTGGSIEAGKDRSAKYNAPVFYLIGSGVQVGDKILLYAYHLPSPKKAKSYLHRAKLDGGILEPEASMDLPATNSDLADSMSGVYASGGKVWLTYANTLYSVGQDLKLTKVMTSSKPGAYLSVSGNDVLELFERFPLPLMP